MSYVAVWAELVELFLVAFAVWVALVDLVALFALVAFRSVALARSGCAC